MLLKISAPVFKERDARARARAHTHTHTHTHAHIFDDIYVYIFTNYNNSNNNNNNNNLLTEMSFVTYSRQTGKRWNQTFFTVSRPRIARLQ